MRLADLDYTYPLALIAQEPLPERDGARLLWLDRHTGSSTHQQIRNLPQLLAPGDLLVCNDSRVLPLRLTARRGTMPCEVLLLEELPGGVWATWRAFTTKMKRLAVGERLDFSPELRGDIIGREKDTLQIRFNVSAAQLRDALLTLGTPPLPPYIQRAPQPDDRTRYQTIFARTDGSAAAPTAGLHLSERLMAACRARGIEIAFVTLHIGRDTFQPIRVDNLHQHQMHGEYFSVPDATHTAIVTTRAHGGRVVAVGTTTARALESMAALDRPEGTTQLFILPGFHFRLVSALLTNFHQPRTTLLALVAAFAGRDQIQMAYRTAIQERYRLFSYGDAMLIL